MTEATTPPGTTSTLPHPSANPRSGSPPQAGMHVPPQTGPSPMRTTLIASLAALIVVVIFIIQNLHAANISFLGVHLVLPLAGALVLAAIAGSLLTVAAGPTRISRLRQTMRRGLRKARANSWAPYDRSPYGPESTPQTALEAPAAFPAGDLPGNTTAYASHVND
jgi:lipopolysaccharide assembly protein A